MGERQNVIIILTDDQGYGDLACHGNPVLKTPALDRLASQSVRLTDFHVAPMCTPTRCSLMSGMSSIAGGACFVDGGRTMLRPQYPTMAELFADTGYRTALFGKWHLGDNYPYRPEDRGFHEAIHHAAWGISSSADYWNNDYFDDTYSHNGAYEPYTGYCTDVWFSEAMKWIESVRRDGPFLAYIATNAPHGPLFVGDEFRADYGSLDAALASFFGMIACIDANVDRLMRWMDDQGLFDDTILVYMTDNGGTVGVNFYNAGMRGRKTSVYEGGHRVPCFIRTPNGRLGAPRDVDLACQAEDILPTLLELCGAGDSSLDPAFDGSSLVPALSPDEPVGSASVEALRSRDLVVQYGCHHQHPFGPRHLGDPCPWDCCVMSGPFRLVYGEELYDVSVDPGQIADVSREHPEIVRCLRAFYETWWSEREATLYDWCHIPIGAAEAPEVRLTSHTWVDQPVTMQAGSSETNSIRMGSRNSGPWNVEVSRPGRYRLSLRRWPKEANTAIRDGLPEYLPGDPTFGPLPAGRPLLIEQARVSIQGRRARAAVKDGDLSADIEIDLAPGTTQLQTWFCDRIGNALCGAYYADVRRLE